MTDSIEKFESLVRDITGFDSEYQWPISIENGIALMMRKLEVSTPSILYQCMKQSPDILFDFIQLFTINETYFNREPLLFELTSNILVPELLIENRSNKALNILSAGCSTGEEPYSLVISMVERYGIGCSKLFNFHAVDIDIETIFSARKACYNKRSVHMLDPRLRDIYFHQIAFEKYQLKNIIKNAVIFYQSPLQNIDDVFPNTKMDIIFYRNVSIYFDPQTRQKVFNTLANILKPNGFLIMSPTETFAHDFERLSLITKENIFVFQNLENSKSSEQKKAQYLFDKKPETHKIPLAESLDQVIDLANGKHYQYALEQLDIYLQQHDDDLQALILKACILTNKQQLLEARIICEAINEKDPFNESACLLLGQIERLDNNMEDAYRHFKQVLYSNPNNWLAHYYLSKIYEEKHKIDHAIHAYQIIIKLLNEGKFYDHGLLFFPFSFSKTDIIFLCNSRLEVLSK